MKLEQFKEKNQKKKIIISTCVLVVLLLTGLFLYRSFAFFESQKNYDAIKGIVSYSPSDITLTSYLDGTISKTFPSKDDKYAVDSVECSNGAIGTWNYANWEVNIQNLTNTKTKCKVYFVTRYKENILNGTDPIISESLIPVTIANDGTVKKADMKSEWYNYSNKQWANAVILEDETSNYQNGEVIPESNIESYFVWIPRYKFKIFKHDVHGYLQTIEDINLYKNLSQEIEVIFENKNTTVSNGSTVGSYLTHPAFTSFDSNGMWVGKFETGYKGATTKDEANQNNVDISKIEIKADAYIWKNIQLANAHLNSYNYKREIDSHLIKNTEWGSVAILQYSIFGNKEARLNNNNDYKTGYGSVNKITGGFNSPNCSQNPSQCNENGTDASIVQLWNTEVGCLASTTGNISGIYDMTGGSYEQVMGGLYNDAGQMITGGSNVYNTGFNGIFGCPTCDEGADTSITELTTGIDLPDEKYYDKYPVLTDFTSYKTPNLGDCTTEMGPFYVYSFLNSNSRWYNSWDIDEAYFPDKATPWFIRGGGFGLGTGAGVFAFNGNWHNGENGGFRVVLTP